MDVHWHALILVLALGALLAVGLRRGPRRGPVRVGIAFGAVLLYALLLAPILGGEEAGLWGHDLWYLPAVLLFVFAFALAAAPNPLWRRALLIDAALFYLANPVDVVDFVRNPFESMFAVGESVFDDFDHGGEPWLMFLFIVLLLGGVILLAMRNRILKILGGLLLIAALFVPVLTGLDIGGGMIHWLAALLLLVLAVAIVVALIAKAFIVAAVLLVGALILGDLTLPNPFAEEGRDVVTWAVSDRTVPQMEGDDPDMLENGRNDDTVSAPPAGETSQAEDPILPGEESFHPDDRTLRDGVRDPWGDPVAKRPIGSWADFVVYARENPEYRSCFEAQTGVTWDQVLDAREKEAQGYDVDVIINKGHTDESAAQILGGIPYEDVIYITDAGFYNTLDTGDGALGCDRFFDDRPRQVRRALALPTDDPNEPGRPVALSGCGNPLPGGIES